MCCPLRPFSGMETNICSHVDTVFPNKTMPILSKLINPEKEGKVTREGEAGERTQATWISGSERSGYLIQMVRGPGDKKQAILPTG